MTMEIRDVPGHPGYRVSASGKVFGKTGRPLKQFVGTGGYLRFTTYESGRWQQVSTHVMICQAFHGPRPEGMHAAHKNGDLTDNRAENLRWATGKENEADKIRHGRSLQGARHHQAKLTEKQVLDIRYRRSSGDREIDLAKEFGVSVATISNIHRRKNWRHL